MHLTDAANIGVVLLAALEVQYLDSKRWVQHIVVYTNHTQLIKLRQRRSVLVTGLRLVDWQNITPDKKNYQRETQTS